MFWRIGSLAVVGLVALVAPPARGDEQEIPVGQIPAAVKRAADKAVPHTSWTKAYRETEDGETTYSLEGKNPDGREVEAEVGADGKVIEVALEVPLAQVPKTVLDALKAKYPRFRPTDAEAVSQEGRLVAYDLEGKMDGKEAEVRVSADGKKVELEDDDD